MWIFIGVGAVLLLAVWFAKVRLPALAVQAQADCYRAMVSARRAEAGLLDAIAERARAEDRFRDLPVILATDRAERRAELDRVRQEADLAAAERVHRLQILRREVDALEAQHNRSSGN